MEQAPLVRTTCPYCGVGCGVLAARAGDGAVTIAGDPRHPANFGKLCSKGSALAETLDHDGRLLNPEIGGCRAGWDEALDLVALRFLQAVRAHGPESVALYVSGQLLTEDYYVANKLMKGFIGSANIDTNSRLCMASAVAGHLRAFGSDVVPGTYEDLELADLIVLVGSNLAWCHPVLYQRIAAAKAARPEMKVVLVDPRRTMTSSIADVHLAIRPDGDVALFSGLLSWLARCDALDHRFIAEHTNGVEEAVGASIPSLAESAERTGVSAQALAAFFALFAATPRTVTLFSQGVNQSASGTDKVNAIINCHLATGRIGKPGMGPFSITGQPNAMGGREVGGLANMLAAHMRIEEPGDRDRVQRFWNSPSIAAKPGLKAVDLFAAAGDGRIKALWIMATSPADSLPDADTVEAALEACPFVVVSDVMADTDTARHAHVKLPAAAWGEKDGTVTNSERRISRQRRFLDPPGEARPDWWIVAQVARRMGFGEAFPYTSPAEIFAEHAALSAFENGGERAFDIGRHAGLDTEAYQNLQPFQWPCPARTSGSKARFFGAGGFYTPDHRAVLVPVKPPGKSAESSTDDSFPLTLNTGRIRDQWHTMTRTGKSPRLSQHLAEPFAELNPMDARRLGIADAEIVQISTRHGSTLVRAMLTDRQNAGSIFVPIHWTDRFSARARVGALVAPVIDAVSGQPASKNGAARVERFPAAAYGFAILRDRPHAVGADYWTLARWGCGWRVDMAFAEPAVDWPTFAASLLGAESADDLLAYHDRDAGQHRLARFDGPTLLGLLFLAPAPVAVSSAWAAGQLEVEHRDRRRRFAVIAGRPGDGRHDIGAIVCSCFGVGASQIADAVANGCGSVEEVGRLLRAGSSCGSCRAEIRILIDGHPVQPAE